MIRWAIYIFLFILPFNMVAQTAVVSFDHILTDKEIIDLLDVNRNPELKVIQKNYYNGKKEQALKELTIYLKEKFSERYFFNWKNFPTRFSEYNEMYPARFEFHKKAAYEHLELYPDYTQWKLPFANLNGEAVSSYPYRHLTRQHKSVDIALLYHYTKDLKYLHYIPRQAQSLNEAFARNEFETIEDGNGVYEVYRAGNRMFNWLFAHQCLLASGEYTWQEQLTMIKTFLHTGAQLHFHNPAYHEGNHQTRGMSALAMLSILLKDFKGTDEWRERSIARLEEHLNKEIYPDGFQFERSVHYHIDDIANYFYPYQLAHINKMQLKPLWDERIKGLFDVLVKIAMPDKNAPVLQDDTNKPWAEFNEIGSTMALGTALFSEPGYKYFAADNISSSYYWMVTRDQVDSFKKLEEVKPDIKSTELPYTGYYIMRNGWEKDDLYMIISAGLTKEKIAHQHGDMLGVQAYAFGNMVLPNYQVRYYLEDLAEFKNSFTKNVSIVDSVPHGRSWKGNKGGSGFGLWEILPEPKVISWYNSNEVDFFVGSHYGYEDFGVRTYRQVIFIKDGFWFVRDHFISEKNSHKYQQVWQGHYSKEDDRHVRSVFPDGAGLEIVQMGHIPNSIKTSSSRGKGRLIFESEKNENIVYSTFLYPFRDFENRLYDFKDYDNLKIEGWEMSKKQNNNNGKTAGYETDAALLLRKNNLALLFDCTYLKSDNRTIDLKGGKGDLLLEKNEDNWTVVNCGIKGVGIVANKQEIEIKPGSSYQVKW